MTYGLNCVFRVRSEENIREIGEEEKNRDSVAINIRVQKKQHRKEQRKETKGWRWGLRHCNILFFNYMNFTYNPKTSCGPDYN